MIGYLGRTTRLSTHLGSICFSLIHEWQISYRSIGGGERERESISKIWGKITWHGWWIISFHFSKNSIFFICLHCARLFIFSNRQLKAEESSVWLWLLRCFVSLINNMTLYKIYYFIILNFTYVTFVYFILFAFSFSEIYQSQIK
jgi:hypothetical protein